VAISYSKKIVGLIPTAFALILYGFAYTKSAREQQAARAFESFRLRLNQTQYSAAKTDIERAVTLSPKNAYYLANQGLLLVRMSRTRFDSSAFLEKRLIFSQEEAKQIDAAAQYYHKSLQINPLDDSHYHNLGWLYSFLQQRNRALECFQKAISLDSSIALYHISLGLLYEQGSESEDAYREYELAVRLSPAISDSHFFRDLKERSPEAADHVISESILHLEDELKRNPTPILKGKLGKLYLHIGLLDKAFVLLQQASMELPSLSRPWYNLGNIYELQGDERSMRECYQRATFLDGNDTLSWLKLANSHERHNNKPEAIRSYARAVSSWLNIVSEHARRASRIYHLPFIVYDDIVPNEFLSYCGPFFDVSGVCLKLAKLYEETGDARLANYYENLSISLK
jgi:tetratricopeptide (TPR) repeat protein